MPNTQYLEFDSTYRDRSLYPLPSDFIVEISQSGIKGKTDSLSPICESSPVLIWNNSFDEVVDADSIVVTNINDVSLPNLLGNITFRIQTDDSLRQVRNFYVGASFEISTDTQQIIRRVVDYQPLNLTNAIITLDSAIPDSLPSGYTATIYNPTPLDTTTSDTVIKVFVPGSNDCLSEDQKTQTRGLGGENFYVGYYIQYNDVSNDYSLITGFDSVTRLATLESKTTNDWATANKNMVIRKELPLERGTVPAMTSSTTTITLASTASSVSNFYVGDFIRIVPVGQIPPYSAPYTEERRIISYNNTTKVITVNPPFDAVVASGMIYEIEPFSKDGASPFVYTGSIVSISEMVCYEVELLNLVLPNTLLKSGRGGRAIFYPYFYVELQQVSSASAGNKGILYSNNPNAFKTLTFRALMTDTTTPVISPFIKIDSDGQVFQVKFKPDDSFRFVVKHADGELFQTVIEDTIIPTEPNPLAQISACFAFKRI